MTLRVAALVLLLGRAVAARAQLTVELRDKGVGPGPEALALALQRPHATVGPGSTAYVVAKGSSVNQTLIVIGRDAILDGAVHGDVIVVSGDLYVHPGGEVDGRALALGGGVYASALAIVEGGATAFRDLTYDVAPIPGGVALTYRAYPFDEAEPALALTGLFGLHVPAYDRSDGLSLAIGPDIRVPASKIRLDPRVTYRSQLGRLDPFVSATDSVGRAVAIRARVGRGSFTNEEWIAGDLINSAEMLWGGEDARNYFRATRAEAALSRQWARSATTIEPYIGARWERDRDVRPGLFATGGPWTFFGRRSAEDAMRPNPQIDQGDISSLLAGAEMHWTSDGVVARARVDEELGRVWSANRISPSANASTGFAQTTFEGSIQFPTFGTQSIHIRAHALYSTDTPRQRFSYLGGVGTVSTLELLSRGGDELVYLDGRYIIPLSVTLPLGVSPNLMLREVLGGATTGEMPSLAQATGVRVALSVVYAELMVDPSSRKAHFSYGISVAR